MSKQDEYFEVIVHLFGLSEAASNKLREIIEIGGLYRDTEPMLTLSDFSRHMHGKVHPVGNLNEDTSPFLQPSPRSKKVYVADLKGYKCITQWLTEGKAYEVRGCCPLVVENDRLVYVECDTGEIFSFSKYWFREVYLYDEDETLLTCRDIKFQEGDYIDLRKHTPEQIRHIAEYYEVYDVEGLLEDSGYIFAVFDGVDFDGTDSYTRTKGKQYTYDDIFYLGNN